MSSFVHNPPKSKAKFFVGGFTNGKNGSTGTDSLVQIQDLKDLIASGGTGGGTGSVTDAQLALALQGYVKTSGATMTGQLNTVTASAAANAANKTYVDSTTVSLSGDTMTGTLNMGNNGITNVRLPTNNDDVATKLYVDTKDSENDIEVQTKLSKYGDTATGYLKMTLQPVASTDLCNKSYTDNAIATSTVFQPINSKLTTISAITPTANCVIGTDATGVVLMTPTQTRAAIDVYSVPEVTSVLANYLPLTGGVMTGKISGIQTPTNPTDAVNKSYADMLTAGLVFYPAVACYITLVDVLFIYDGGQQITDIGTPVFDYYTLQQGDRVLVNTTTNYAANGVYVVTNLSTETILVRPTDLDGSPLGEFEQGGLFYVTNGTVYGGSLFVQTSPPPTVLGTSPIIYSQYSAAKNIAAGANIAITGNQIAVNSSLTGISSITGLTGPINPEDAASKYYVDTRDASRLVASTAYANTKLSIAGGTMTGSINMGTKLITNVASIAFNGTSSTDALTLSKQSGGAAYALALPAAAPESNTYLKYDGTNYAWSPAASTLTGGSNINITSNAIGLNTSLTGITAITGLTNPVNAADAANKAYVDSTDAANMTDINARFDAQDVDISFKLPLAGGTMTGPIDMGTHAISKVASLEFNVQGGIGDTLMLSKFPGTPYRISFPGAPPAPNTYLRYDGTNGNPIYSWASAASTLTAGSNIDITNNVVSLATTLTGITSITGLADPVNASDAVNKAYLDAIDADIIQFVDMNYAYLAGLDAAKLPLAGGTMSGAINMGGQAITNAVSIALNGTSSTDALTLSKETGGAAYTLALPAAAPAASTYLQYDGANYAWASAGTTLTAFTGASSGAAGTLGGVPAPQAGDETKYLQGNGTWSAVSATAAVAAQYYYASLTSNPAANTNMVFNTNVVPGGTAITTTNGSSFTLAVGYTYKIFVNVTYNNFSQTNAVTTLTIYNNSTVIATADDFIYTSGCMVPFVASAFITPTVTANITVRVDYAMVMTPGFISIEVVSNNNTITAFTGATSVANGTVGYIPAPQAGTQNSYLRGDGSWQQANNAPTAANYLFATSLADQTITTPPYAVTFPNILLSSGTTSPSTSTFVLAAGATYVLKSCLTYCSAGTTYRWANMTSGTRVYIGEAGDIGNSTAVSGIAIAYISATVSTTVALYVTSGSSIIRGQSFDASARGPWVEILQLSNNNTITAFTGATSVANGTVGYIPAPLAGTQNSYLRGDGTWQQANNAPTAAQYVYASHTVNVTITSNNSGTIANWYFPFNAVNNVSSAITMPSSSTFTLAAGCTYKCTFEVSRVGGQVCYGWYNITTPQKVGSWAALATGDTQHNIAIAYITTTATPVTVGVAFSYGNGMVIEPVYSTLGPVSTWATIEVVSNNNTITAFTGATATLDGAIGYIPKPLTGQQNYVLTGAGTWQPASTSLAYSFISMYRGGAAVTNSPDVALVTTNPGGVNDGFPFDRYTADSPLTNPFVVVNMTGSPAVTNTNFTLTLGRTYRLTACLSYFNVVTLGTVIQYSWLAQSGGTTAYIARPGGLGSGNTPVGQNDMNRYICECVYTPTVANTVVRFTNVASNAGAYAGTLIKSSTVVSFGQCAFVKIEVIG